MCGIVAIIHRDREEPVILDDLVRMVRILRHRGPDEEGSVVLSGVGLAMRRLSIVDLGGGQQPFLSEDASIYLVANGEIYNFEEMKAELIQRGHVFRSRSDIEVLVHAYEEYGEAFLNKIRGMFALALWDERKQMFLAARDRAGEKPLYYSLTERGLLLASEIKALLVRSDVSRQPNIEALDQFLTYGYSIAPQTLFAAVKKLPAAHCLMYRNGQLTVTKYWDAAETGLRVWKETEAVEALRSVLSRAISSQLMSDVPLGVFLSGGIDSSAIVALMSEEPSCRNNGINTFSLGFKDGSYNELPYAREVAQRFGTCHREGTLQPDLVELFDELVVHLDEPFADVSLFPTYLLSQITRQHVKVALSGDGGDELFGGYDTYVAERLARQLARTIPQIAISALASLVELFPPNDRKKGFVNKVRRFAQGLRDAPSTIEHYRWMTFLSAEAKKRLYTPMLQQELVNSDVYRPVREYLQLPSGDDLLNRQLYADLSVYLSDDILVKVDRMSMATSLETRAPFLDVDVMELAFSMPGDLKIRGTERKYILKRALRGLLPESILTRSKEGFSIPMKNWLRGSLCPLMDDLLASDRIIKRGWFNPIDVQRRITEHKAGRENHAHTLFSLMVLERWAQEFLS